MHPILTPKIAYFETLHGSRYTYLHDGRTQRHEQEAEVPHAPQDITVFLPSFRFLKKQTPRSEDMRKALAESIQKVKHFPLYVHNEHASCCLLDQAGNRLESTKEIVESPITLYLACMNGSHLDFFLRVEKEPRFLFQP